VVNWPQVGNFTGISFNKTVSKMFASQRTHKSTSSVWPSTYCLCSLRWHTLTDLTYTYIYVVLGPNLKSVQTGMDGNNLDRRSCFTCLAPIQWWLTTYCTIVTLFNTPISISNIQSIKQLNSVKQLSLNPKPQTPAMTMSGKKKTYIPMVIGCQTSKMETNGR
jgi:hypothetical protein